MSGLFFRGQRKQKPWDHALPAIIIQAGGCCRNLPLHPPPRLLSHAALVSKGLSPKASAADLVFLQDMPFLTFMKHKEVGRKENSVFSLGSPRCRPRANDSSANYMWEGFHPSSRVGKWQRREGRQCIVKQFTAPAKGWLPPWMVFHPQVVQSQFLIWGAAAVTFLQKYSCLASTLMPHPGFPAYGFIFAWFGLWFSWHLWTIYIPVVAIYKIHDLERVIPTQGQAVLLLNGPGFAQLWACLTQPHDSPGRPDIVVSSWL